MSKPPISFKLDWKAVLMFSSQAIEQDACQSRALVACWITADAGVPNHSQYRALHSTREVCDAFSDLGFHLSLRNPVLN